jgi:predicted RNase H-like HicB family nuclease
MAKLFYPAVLEKGAKGAFGVWFPDFPDCVAAGRSQEDVIEKAELELARAVVGLAERQQPLPEPTPFERIERPSRFVAFFVVGVEPPNPSERVNIYLPKRLLERADQAAAEMGMSRSSFFGFAVSSIVGLSYAYPGVTARRKAGEGETAKKERPRAKR